jgi:hypothetical protein
MCISLRSRQTDDYRLMLSTPRPRSFNEKRFLQFCTTLGTIYLSVFEAAIILFSNILFVHVLDSLGSLNTMSVSHGSDSVFARSPVTSPDSDDSDDHIAQASMAYQATLCLTTGKLL